MLANLNDVLADARKERYAVGLFNTTDTDMLEAAVSTAERLRSPIIIGTAEILLPYGELALIAPALLSAAARASVPVVVHYDHGLTFERCMEALRLGFTSVMYDASHKPYAQNARETREIVRIAHSFGATVEGEIGHVGSAEAKDETNLSAYTTAQEAEQYLTDTSVDALAIAIGTAHGVYKTAPKLSLEHLRRVRQAVDAPLVLHGGSGLSDQDFQNAVQAGISKINIFTDLCLTGMASLNDSLAKGLDYLSARNEKVQAISGEIEKKMRLFGSVGRA